MPLSCRISFRSPAGVKSQQDLSFTTPEGGNTGGTAWHSNAIFINDNVATQIDGLGHITHGPDNHFYNGFKAADWGATSACARLTSRPFRQSLREAC
jgi:hypothetical protein